MDFEIVKEVCVEYCEDMYAIVVNYLNKDNSVELGELLNQLADFEDNIRVCNDINKLFEYKKRLEQFMNRIEVIINA